MPRYVGEDGYVYARSDYGGGYHRVHGEGGVPERATNPFTGSPRVATDMGGNPVRAREGDFGSYASAGGQRLYEIGPSLDPGVAEIHFGRGSGRSGSATWVDGVRYIALCTIPFALIALVVLIWVVIALLMQKG